VSFGEAAWFERLCLGRAFRKYPGANWGCGGRRFQKNGYKARQTDPSSLVFEKQGSRMNNFAYGSWMGDTPVWIRVKGNVLPVGQMTYRLECTPYLVRDIGTGAEEELPVNGLHRAPYQKLLDEVALRLGRK